MTSSPLMFLLGDFRGDFTPNVSSSSYLIFYHVSKTGVASMLPSFDFPVALYVLVIFDA